ncbi:hypothetical protein BVY04_04315 [bacterium M21]|nr:hypothetical protein BVY04_04315 [bacterium M21]
MKHSRFTIIELVVAMAIAFIIISLTASTFMRSGGGARLNSTVQTLGSELLRARQLAQAERRLIAVLLPGDEATGVPTDNKYGCFRIAYVEMDDSGATTKYDFTDFPDDTEWGFTRPGISIMEADNDLGIRDGSTNKVEPYENDHVTVDNVDLSALGGNNSVDGIRAVIFSPANRLKGGYTLYVTVGQATFNEGTWHIKDQGETINSNGDTVNISCTNQMTLEINQYTAGVRYLRPYNYPN